MKTIRERIESHIEMIPECGCWISLYRTNQWGYARILIKGKIKVVHRAYWEEVIGKIPEGLYLCHKCDTPSCINPNHLFLGTQLDNMNDAADKGRIQKLKGSCHGMAKLTDNDIKTIRADNRSNKEIASNYGVTSQNINMIKKRKTWKHI